MTMKFSAANILTTVAAMFRKMVRWYVSLYKGRKWYTRTAVALASFLTSIIVFLVLVDINFLWLFGKSPGIHEIKNPVICEASEVYTADSVLIGKFFSENRTPVEYEEVNKCFWTALVDTEDERFYSHHGIDVYGLFAAVKDAVLHHDARGASTITQQLAKNMFRVRTQYSTGLLGKIPGVKMLIMKSKEWIIATKLEIIYDKNEILTMYANTVDFGSNAFGINTACKTYFATTPAQLTPDQAATLVGMLKATTYYNPKLNPKNSKKRRNVVLDIMRRKGDITDEEYKIYSQRDIRLKYSVENNYGGKAMYFREAVAHELREWCKENGYDLYTSGLKIYTSLNSHLQEYAEKAVTEQMHELQKKFDDHWRGMEPWRDERHQVIEGFIEDIARRQPIYKYLKKKYKDNNDSIDYYLNKPHKVKLFDYENGTIEQEMSTMDSIRYMVKFMHCSFVAMDPRNAHVLAWVGDIDFKWWKYDKVKAMRQPGSTFKLFGYTEAMNQGFTPTDTIVDEPFTMKVFDKQQNKEVWWSPSNANGTFEYAAMPLKSAFARSVNSIAVRLGQQTTTDSIVKTAHAMGIKSPLHSTPSLTLGASDVNLLEMVNAYATVADGGQWHRPVIVTRVYDHDDRLVYEEKPETKRAISERSAFFMQRMLMGGLTEHGGTSMNLWRYIQRSSQTTDFGGKTGTSNNHSDAWFMGVTPRIVTGAWVGGEYRCIHFRTGMLGQGSRTALPVCGKFYEQMFDDPRFDSYKARFVVPDDPTITPNMYIGWSYEEKPDSLLNDSLGIDSLGKPLPVVIRTDIDDGPRFAHPDSIIFRDR